MRPHRALQNAAIRDAGTPQSPRRPDPTVPWSQQTSECTVRIIGPLTARSSGQRFSGPVVSIFAHEDNDLSTPLASSVECRQSEARRTPCAHCELVVHGLSRDCICPGEPARDSMRVPPTRPTIPRDSFIQRPIEAEILSWPEEQGERARPKNGN